MGMAKGDATSWRHEQQIVIEMQNLEYGSKNTHNTQSSIVCSMCLAVH